jgi:tRNA-Thr(GGU) m(6)t(6)A37 methyltransferase TsaA
MLSLDVSRIGSVRNTGDGRSLLELLPPYRAGLEGMTPGDQVQVLYWMHELQHADRRSLCVTPRGDERLPQRGVFALRCPMRPNPIGVSDATVVERREHGLVVTQLDAHDGSPLIDIKAICRP